MGYHLGLINLLEPWASAPSGSDDAAQTVSTSRARLESLVRLYYVRHGFGGPDVLLLLYLLILGSISLKSLTATKRSPGAFCTLYLCARGLSDQGKNNYLGTLMFRVLVGLTSSADACLQSELARIQTEATGADVLLEHVDPEWPVFRWIRRHDEAQGRECMAVGGPSTDDGGGVPTAHGFSDRHLTAEEEWRALE